MNKKVLIILGIIFLLIVGTLGFLIFEKKSADKTSVVATANSNTPSNTAPITTTPTPGSSAVSQTTQQSSTPSKLTDSAVVSPVLFYNGAGITYFTPDGLLYQADLGTSTVPYTLENLKNIPITAPGHLDKILWPAQGNDFIAHVTTSTGSAWSYFNSDTGGYTQLPPQIKSVDWTPGGKQIMYVWVQNGAASLFSANPDNSNWQKIAALPDVSDTISVSPNGQSILYYQTNNPASPTNTINMASIDGKVMQAIVKDGYNYGVLWSPDSQKFLFSKKNSATGKYQLWMYTLATNQELNLGLNTISDKAVWSSDGNLVYAAVPQVGTAGTGQLTQDALYVFKVATKATQELTANNSTIFDGEDLFLSADNTVVFFRNVQDGSLYDLQTNQ